MNECIFVEVLDEIARGCAAATPRPWKSEGRNHTAGGSFMIAGPNSDKWRLGDSLQPV